MKIIKSDFKKGIVTVRVTDLDDIWYLRYIIEEGDLVKAKTTRKIKIGDTENAKVTKKTLTLTIEAETIDIADSGHAVRINGKIREGPEDLPRDQYHALSLEEGVECTITKPNWLAYQKQKLEEATREKSTYLLCVLDREEVLFAITKKKGFKKLTGFKGDVPKKGKDVDIKKDFHQEIIKLLEEYTKRFSPENIIVASPAFYKEDLVKKVKDEDLKKKIVLATCSTVNASALDEVMKRPELATVLKGSRARKEKMLVEELLTEIQKDALAVYGIRAVQHAISAGAVSKLLLTDSFIQKQKEKKTFDVIDEQMKHVDALKGEIHIISSEQESGKKLDGLGGIAALLRYKIA